MENKSIKENGIVIPAIYCIAFLLLLIGVFQLISGLTGNYIALIQGVSCLVACPLVWGYAYIVEAAIKYIDKN